MVWWGVSYKTSQRFILARKERKPSGDDPEVIEKECAGVGAPYNCLNVNQLNYKLISVSEAKMHPNRQPN
ncbi:hypothetical protein TNCV_87761 [Trichonephila clavipes]|nr:hypothetical protein TNCV_87761 [Trichonephila clavipes]